MVPIVFVWIFDISMPLIPGARPVNIRPYCYPPALRDEIEKQVADMLHKGLIQPSTSPFSSPVLLVKKKDGSYHFCVDFRHLNALTMKSKFPVPVFDQLMEELASASWFSNFDLRAGFHQILLKPGEEFKTAFQTHFGPVQIPSHGLWIDRSPRVVLGRHERHHCSRSAQVRYHFL